MAHGILETDHMFSVKERPWHGLGTVVETAPTIEEALELAKLNWDVEYKELVTTDGIKIDGKRATVRTDNNQVLGIVSKSYSVLQNRDAFKFFDTFIENDMATLETAGSLFNGKRTFILAKIAGEDMHITDEDVVQKYILLSNSHDGSAAVKVGYTPIRVVCNNTLTAAEASVDSELLTIYHRGNPVETLEEVKKTMDTINRTFLTTEENFKKLAQMQIKPDDLRRYVRKCFSTKKLEKMLDNPSDYTLQDVENFRKKLIDRVEEIFELEPVHNRWTAYNSVNYYLNHERSRNVHNTYSSMWFGDAKKLDAQALQYALTM